MLDTFRENARSWIVQTMIAAISLVFIFSFGPGSRGCRSSTTVTNASWAAKVNGQEIPAANFQELYNFRAMQMQQYGLGSEEQLRTMNIREDVMKAVVEQELLAQAAEKNGLYISDTELAQSVRRSGRFDENGKFDPEAYRNYIQTRESAKNFEARFRRLILAERESELAAAAVPVSDDELKVALMEQDEAASIAFVKFLPGNFRDQVQVTPADIDAEIKDHSADLQKRYEGTKMLYTEPKAVKARRLFVPVKLDATPAEEQAAKKKIDDASAALKSGKKWEDLAPQFTNDPMSGGDLGWVQLGRSTLGRSTEEAIFKLHPGQTSDVVRDRFGYEILQAQEERAPSEKKFEDVKRDIATDFLRETKAKDLAKAAAEKTLAQLKAGQSLESQWPKEEKAEAGQKPDLNASKTPHTVVTSEFHPAGGMIPQAGSVPEISSVVFSLGADKRWPDSVIDEQNAYWVIELKSRKRADLSKLASMKDTLRDKVANEKRNALRKQWIEQLRKGAKIEENQDFLSYERKASSRGQQPDDS